jgi:hypothetical protein
VLCAEKKFELGMVVPAIAASPATTIGCVTMKKQKQTTKRERLHDILGRYGDGLITTDQFLEEMRQHKLTADDIDAYCRGELND